jgi:hypothetical protein
MELVNCSWEVWYRVQFSKWNVWLRVAVFCKKQQTGLSVNSKPSLLFTICLQITPFSFFLSFLTWRLLPDHCRSSVIICTWSLSVTLSHTHTHTHTHTHSGLLWTRDRSVAETCTSQPHNTYKTQTSMTPAGFEPAIPASERSQNYALDRTAAGTGLRFLYSRIISLIS